MCLSIYARVLKDNTSRTDRPAISRRDQRSRISLFREPVEIGSAPVDININIHAARTRSRLHKWNQNHKTHIHTHNPPRNIIYRIEIWWYTCLFERHNSEQWELKKTKGVNTSGFEADQSFVLNINSNLLKCSDHPVFWINCFNRHTQGINPNEFNESCGYFWFLLRSMENNTGIVFGPRVGGGWWRKHTLNKRSRWWMMIHLHW